MLEIQYVGRNFKFTEKVKQQIKEKIGKHSKFLDRATNITAIVTKNKTDRGDLRNLKLEVAIDMPNVFIKVEERGQELRSMIDSLEVVLRRRLQRYHDQFSKWTRKQPWKVQEITPEVINDNIELNNFEPKIKRKTYEDDRPINPAEAIERMELLGHKSYLFKNIETGKYAMIYKRDITGYGLIEPK